MRAKYISLFFIMFNLVLLTTITGCGESEGSSEAVKKKVLVLGFDGMDPKILRRLVDEGKLPNFGRLIETGDFKPLGTSVPPQSPVAWSNFTTGMNPGGHGVFDFIHRDPETMAPYLSTSKTEAPERTVKIGSWVIPLSAGKVSLLRHGKAFWEYLEAEKIPTTVFRVPANFPTVESDMPVYQLSGMGTPDIQGTYGTFSYYTGEQTAREGGDEISGGRIFPVRVVDNKVKAQLLGPKNTLKEENTQTTADFTVFVDPENPVAKIAVQDQQIILKQGEWSEWVTVNFDIIPFFQSVSGIARFYLKEVHPDFKMYVTPINIDPAAPALPISTPEDYSKKLAKAIGPFYTQGIPEDSKALSEGVLDDGEFFQQANIVLGEELKMYEHELNRFKSGLLFFYFGRTDQLAHMFWRTMDPNHPAYDPKSKFRRVIEQTYIDMDQVLGKALKKVDDNTTLIVLSDHGFAPFYRAFNLNTWLKNEGYASLTDDTEGDFFQNVDWGRTRAYGAGFNGLYVNLDGREVSGIVQPWEKDELLDEISKKLLAVRDPKTGERVITKIYRADDEYSGSYVKDGPDLIVGYNSGYRASWETVLGKFPKQLLRDNDEKWSGDHLIEAALVPGVLLSNKKIKSENPALYDLAPTILAEFGISKKEGMVGNNVFTELSAKKSDTQKP